MPVVLDYAAPPLRRQVGLFGATMLGLGSILGTGVFVGLAQATALAGPWVLLAIVLAGLLAFCNAMSSAQLAAAHPVSGGTYEYGYRLLSPAWGFTAGWTFLLAKSASAATAALGVAWYVSGIAFDRHGEWAGRLAWLLQLVPFGVDQYRVVAAAVALLLVCAITALTLTGVWRTNFVNIALVTVTTSALLLFVLVCSSFAWERWRDSATWRDQIRTSPNDLLNATALCFVAFTGYGRLATIGEEVQNPKHTIPRAITICLAVSVLLYLGVGFIHASVFPNRTEVFYRHSEGVVYGGPLNGVAALYSRGLIPLITLSALTAMLGVFLNLILGLSRVWLAMGRRGDMPRGLARVSGRTGTPVPATILSGLVIAAFILVGDVRLTWSFSAFSVLIYYAITNLACLRLPAEHRRHPRALAWAGLVSCLSLAWFVDVKVWAVGVALIGVGLAWHRLRRGHRHALAGPLTASAPSPARP